MTQYLFSLCDLGQQYNNNRSSEKGSSGGLNRISKQFLKIHHDGSYHSFVSRQMAIALKRFINTKFSKSTPEFVTEVHKKLLCLHEYNLEVAKVKSKYPRSRQLDDLLIRYIELECECLYNDRHRFDEKQENYVQKRILKLLHVILFEIFKNNENSIKDTRDLCLKTIIKFFVTVRAESCNDNNIINNVITNLIEKLGLLDEINKFKGKCIPFHLDTCLQDPEISKVRRTLTTSDYESDSSDSDDDFEFSTPPLTYPTTENFSTVSLADMNAIDLSDDDDSFDQAKFKHKPRTFETTQIKNEILQFSPIINNISTDPISILSDDDDDDDDNSSNEIRNDSITNQEDLSNGAGSKLTGIKNKCHNNNDNSSTYQNIINTSNHNSRAQLNGDFINVQRTSTNSTTFTDSFDRFLTNERNYTNVSNTESDIITITDDDDYDFHKITTQLTSNDKNHMPIPILDLDHIKSEVNDEDRSPNLSVINGQINSNILQQTTTLARVNTDMEDMATLQSNSTNQPLEAETNLYITEIHEEIVENPVEIVKNIINSDSNRENVVISQEADDNTVEIAKNINNDVISQKAVENTVENSNNDGSNLESLVISENLQQTEEIIATKVIETTVNEEETVVTVESVGVEENPESSKHISNENLNKLPESLVESVEVSENVKLVPAIDENIDKLSDIDETQVEILENIEKTMEDTVVQEMNNFEETTNIESVENSVENEENVENVVDNETMEKVALDLENSEENSAVDEFIDGITEIIDNISENSETPDEIGGNFETENLKNTEEPHNIEIKEIEQFKNIDNENLIETETIECVEKIIQIVEQEVATSQVTCNADEMPENIEEIEKNTGNNEMIDRQEEIIETVEQPTDTEIISKDITETSIEKHENIEELFENCTTANNEIVDNSSEEIIEETVEKSTEIEVTSNDVTEIEVEEHESIEKLSENNVTLDNSTLEDATNIQVSFNEDTIDEITKETEYTEISSSEITGDTVISHEICVESEIIDENSQNSQIASNDTVEDNSEEKLPTETSKDVENIDGKSNEILEISTETITESQLNEDSIGNDNNKRSEIAENVTEIDQNNTVEDNEHGNEVCKEQEVEIDGNLVEICQNTDKSNDVIQVDQVEMLDNSTEIVPSSLLEDKTDDIQPEIIENSTKLLQNERLENIEELSQSQLEVCPSSDSVLQTNQLENTGNSTEIVSDTPIDVIVEDGLENTEISANINQEDQTNSNENSTEIIEDRKSENMEQVVEILKESQEKMVEETEITNDLVINETNVEISEDFNGDVSKNRLEMTKNVTNDTVIESSIEEINVVETFDKPEMINETIDETHQIESPQNEKTENNRTFTYESTQSPTLNEVEYIDPTHNLGVLATTALAIADSSTTVTVTSLPQKSPEIDESINNNNNTSKRRRSKVRLETGEILPRPHQQQKRLRRHKLEISNENKRITRNSINNNNNIKNNQLEMIKSPKSNRYNNDMSVTTATTKCLAHDFISTENSTIPPQINHVYAQKRLVEANTTSDDSNDSSESTLFIDESNEWKNDKTNERNYNSIYEEETEDDCLKFIDTELNDDDDDDHDDDNRKVTQTEKKSEEVVENKTNSVCISIPDDNDNNQFADNEVLKQMENFVETQSETVDNSKQIEDNQVEEICFDRNEIVHKKFDHEKFIKEKTIQQIDDKLKDNNKIPTDHSIKHILNNVNEQNITVDNNEDTSSKLKETDDDSITNPALTALEDRIIKTKGALKSFDQEKENTATLIENCFESGKNRKIIRSRSKSCNQIINDNVKEKINFNDDLSITKNSKLVTDIATLKNTKIKIKKLEAKQINEEIVQVESDKNQSEVLLDLSIGDKNKTSDIATTTPQEQIEIVETTQDLSNKTTTENLINIGEQNEVVLNNLIIHEKKLETKVRKLELYDTTKPQLKKSPTRDKSKALENTIKKMKERVIKEKNSSEQTQLLIETNKFEGENSSNLIPSTIETKSEKGSNRKQGRTNIDDKSESSKTDRKSSDRHHRSTRSSSKSKTSEKHRENDKKDDRHRSSRSKSSEISVERSRSRSKSKSKSNTNNNSEKERKHSSRSKSKEPSIRKTHSTEKDRKERSKTPTTKIKNNDKDKLNNNLTDNKEERSKSKDTKSHKDIDKNRKVDGKERRKDDKSRSKSPRNLPTDSNKDIDLNKIRDDLKKSLTKNNQETKQKDTKNSRGHSKEKRTVDSDKEKKEKLHKSHKNGDKTKHNLDDNKKHEDKPEKSDSKTKHKIDDSIKKNGVKNEQLNLKNKQKIDDVGKKDDDKNEKINAKTKNKSNESNKKIEAKDIEYIGENGKRNEEKIEKSNEKTKHIEENKSNNEDIEVKKSDKSKEKSKVKETVNEESSTKQQKKKTSIDEIFEEAFKRAELERKSKQQQELIVNNEENKDATNTVSEPIKITENQETRKRRFNDSEEVELEDNKRPKLTENSEESQIVQIENLDHGKIIVNLPSPPPLPLLPPPPPPPSSPPPLPPPLPTSPPPPPPPLPPEIVDETKTQTIKTNLEIPPTKTISKTTNESFERIDEIVTPGAMELESPTKILLTNDIQTTDTFFVNNAFSTACNLNMQVLSSTVDTTVKDFPTETVTSTNLQTSVSIHCGVIAQSVNLVNTTQDPTNLTNSKSCLFTFSNDTTTPTSTVTNSSNLTTLNDLEQMELITTPHHSHTHHHQHHRTTHVMVSLSDSIDVVQNNPPVVETEVVEIQSIQDYDGSFNLGGPMVSGRREEKTITTPTDLTLNDSSPDEFPLTSEELELSFNDNNLIDDYFNPCKTEKPDFDNNIIIDANDTMTTKTDEIQNSIKDLNYLIGITQNDEQNKNDNNDNDIEDEDDSSNSNSTDIDDRTINRPPTDSINDATLYAVNNLISLGSGDSSETHTFTSISDIDIMETSKEAINNLNSAIPSTSTAPDIVAKPAYPSNYLPNQPIETTTTIPIISNDNDDIDGDKSNNNANNDEVQKVIVQKIEQAPISIDILEKSYLNNCKQATSSVTITKNSVSKFIQSVKRNESTKKNDVNDVMEKFTGRKHNRTPVSAPRRNQQKPISSSKSSPQDDLTIDNSNKETPNFTEMRIRVKKDLGATLFDTDLLQEQQQQRHSYAVENLLNLRTNDGEQQSTSDSETSRKRKHLYDDCNGDNEKRRRKSDDSIDDREKRNNEIFDKLLKQGPINKCMLTQNPIASASTSSSSSSVIINTRSREILAKSRADNERQGPKQYPTVTTATTTTTRSEMLNYPSSSSSSSSSSSTSSNNRREGAKYRSTETRQRYTSYPRNLERRHHTDPVVSRSGKWYVKPLLMHSATMRHDRPIYPYIKPEDRKLSAADAEHLRQTYGQTVRNPRLQKDDDKFLWLQKCSGIFDSPPLFEVPENN